MTKSQPIQTAQKILLTGASGLVGSHLKAVLVQKGHEVYSLVRRQESPAANEIFWQPDRGYLRPEQVEGFDVVIHLAGENVMAKRWSSKQKAYLLANRRAASELLGNTLSKLKKPPKVAIFASGVGAYGNHESKEFTETSPMAKHGMAPAICAACEAGLAPLKSAGVRTVAGRFGVVLTPKGGAIEQMKTPFSMGLGGHLGSGKQWFSWVGLYDLIGAIIFVLENDQVAGPVNITSPYPVTNSEFTQGFAHVLHRPAVLPMHALALRVIFGEMAEEFLLKGVKALPQKLLDHGFEFRYPQLIPALEHEFAATKK